MKITLTYSNDEGEEVSCEFHAKYEVCSKCEGHGTHLTPSIGEHAYSQEEFYESFEYEEDRSEYFQRGGIYDVTCHKCNGRNVILVRDEGQTLTPEQQTFMVGYEKYLKEEETAAWEREAERSMGC